LLTVTAEPDCVSDPFQIWVIACPGANDQVSFQPLIGLPRLVMATFAPKPPDH
jgi:hypothetical protein